MLAERHCDALAGHHRGVLHRGGGGLQRSLPTTCTADCANTLLPFWEDCRAYLFEESLALFQRAVRVCTHVSLAEQLNVECTDGTPEADYRLLLRPTARRHSGS